MKNNSIIVVLAVIFIGGGIVYGMTKQSGPHSAFSEENNEDILAETVVPHEANKPETVTPTQDTPAVPTTQNPAPAVPEQHAPAAPPASAVKEFTVTGTSFSFAPSSMTVKKGDKVKITFVNTSGFHDFKIDEFNVATKKINGGEEDVVEFTANKVGTFEYYCSVGSHRAMGMKGTLTVTE